MAFIYETAHFIIESPAEPLVTRKDGGHITISPKDRVNDRTNLSPSLAIELMYLTVLIGEAMTRGLIKRGIDIGRINYQDNGNWGVFRPEGPYLHYHLYGRAKSATIHKYGEACYFPFRDTGFYEGFEPLDSGDIASIQSEIESLLHEEKYKPGNWEL
jgi:diadenosine tetraphosphate (Ap4A) HIT family hydrolase